MAEEEVVEAEGNEVLRSSFSAGLTYVDEERYSYSISTSAAMDITITITPLGRRT